MRAENFFFGPSIVLICLVAITAAGDRMTDDEAFLQETFMTMKTSLAKSFKGEVKENLELLFGVNNEHLKRKDKLAEISQALENNCKDLSYMKTFFEKEKKIGIQSQEYLAALRKAYNKWNNLEKHLVEWSRVEEGAPKKNWTNMDEGLDILHDIQQMKQQFPNKNRTDMDNIMEVLPDIQQMKHEAESQISELEAQHDVYQSKTGELQKGDEASELTYNKVQKETLSKLQSTIDKLVVAKEDILENLERADSVRRTKLGTAAKSWIDEKTDVVQETKHNLNMLAWRTTKTFVPKKDPEKLLANFDPKKLQEYLKGKYNEAITFLVEQFEKKLNNPEEKYEDYKVSTIRQEIVQDGIQFKKERNYLDNTRYSIRNPKHSENPLQQENAVIDVIDNIITHNPKSLKKRFAEKLLDKVTVLRDDIAESSACRFAEDTKAEGEFTIKLKVSAERFRSEVIAVIDKLPSSTRELVSEEAKAVTKYHARNFQKMMDYFGDMEHCAQTLRRIKDTITKVDQWKRKFL